MKKIKNMSRKQLLAWILSITLVINPILLIFLKKTRTKEETTKHTYPITTETEANPELTEKITDDIDEVFNNLTLPPSNKTCTFISEPITSDNLYNKTIDLINTIKNNSINYIANNSEYILGFIDNPNDEFNQDKLMVQSILKDAISDILINSTSKDLCVLNNLKVVICYSKESNNCIDYKKDDNLLIIYPNKEWEKIEYAIRLELNKIRIDNCKCQDTPLFTYNILNNAAITSELYNTNKTEIFISNNDIKNEAIFLSLGLFHDNYTIDDYYKAIFNNNIEALYKFCGANNEEDIYRLNKILYAMNNNIDYDYNTEIFSIVINNLINYTNNNKNFNLKNNLTIFNALKNLFNNEESQQVEEICNMYINYLCKHYNEDINVIINLSNNKEITDYTIALYNLCNKFEKSGTVDRFDLSYSNNLISEFPLLKQVLYLNSYTDYNLSTPLTRIRTRDS